MDCLCFCVNVTNPQHECRCFMFRSKRSNLVKRLLKLRVSQSKNETEGENSNVEELIKSEANSLLKRLKETTLESLLEAVESKGVTPTKCIMLPKDGIRIGRKTISAHVLCCQLWRWPDLLDTCDLKRLPDCNSVTDASSVCCNPYHWSQLMRPGW